MIPTVATHVVCRPPSDVTLTSGVLPLASPLSRYRRLAFLGLELLFRDLRGRYWLVNPPLGEKSTSSSHEVFRPFGVLRCSSRILCGSTHTPSRFDLSHVLAGLILEQRCGHFFRPLPPLGFHPFRAFSHRQTSADSSSVVPLLLSIWLWGQIRLQGFT